jgi:DNA helicase HerA-like ATPase
LEEKASFVFETYSWDTVNQYFGLMEKYEAQGILATEPYSLKVPRRLEIIDLPSILDNETRAIILNSVLAHEWEYARQKWEEAINKSYETDERVPTFIVVDEAHNFVPSEPRTRYEAIVREQFRTIAAEGRKYGLFLILVSQRVDKVDPLVISECSNKAVMRLDTASVVKEVVRSFGLDDVREDIINKITRFKIGRLLLVGNWVNEPTICLTAARRTVEGGRNLREKHWAEPYSNTHQVNH